MSTTRWNPILATALGVALAAAGPASAGPAGGALDCDGTNDVATIPNSSGDFDFDTSLTLETWIRIDAVPQTVPAVSGSTPSHTGAFLLGALIAAGAGFSVSTPSTNTVTGAALTTGVWTHLAGTYDGSTLRIYVNGTLTGSTPHSGNVSDVAELRLCRYPVDNNFFFNGVIDEVRVWNVVRTPSQILDHYQTALHGDEQGLVGYYRFDEGSGQVVADSSDAGNDGFLGASLGGGVDDPQRVISGAPLLAPGPCVRDARTACLLGDRFEVKVAMKNFATPPVGFPGIIQTYQGVSSETDQAVSYYSFTEGNVEVFVKMVNACTNQGFVSFWLFAAGATNADTTITVRDTLSDEIRTIHNPSGVLFQTVADTQAFKTCGF